MKRLKSTGANAGGGGQRGGGWGRGQAETPMNGANGRSLAIATVILVAMLMTIGFAGLAAAVTGDEEFTIVIPIDTVVSAPEGSTTVLATAPVGEEFAGQVCSVATRAENQESVHPGNNLTVASGSSVVVLEDVESGANVVVTADGELVLGTEIVVSLVMGPDELFSAGLEVHVSCSSVGVTTTTLEATTTTVGATTTSGGQVGSTTLPSEEPTSTVEDTVQGTVVTTTTVDDEVEAVEILPFTGSERDGLLVLAASAIAFGSILLVSTRREESE